MRTLALVFAFALAADAAPRTRVVSHPPAGLAITGEHTTADPVVGPSVLIESLPRVATGGGIGLVVWNGGQKAARLDLNGRVLDPFPMAVLSEHLVMSDLVFHDGAFTFAAMPHTATGDLSLVRITPGGEIATRRIAGIAGTSSHDSAALATNGRELLVAVGTREGIETHLVASDGSVLQGPRFAGEQPELASDGTDFLAGYRTAGAAAVRRIRRDGVIGEPAPIAFPQVHDLLWSGTGYVVLGVAGNVLRADRVSAAGVPGDVLLEIPTAEPALFPSISWTGSEYRLMWKQRGASSPRTLTYDLWVARAGANRQVLESVRLRQAADAHGTHVLIGTTDIAGSLMVWCEGIDTGSGNTANIFATSGIGMPVEGVSGRANDQRASAVAQNGAATLVASVDVRRHFDAPATSGISIARVHPDGTRMPGPGTILYPNRGAQDFPDTAWNGVDTWIVWREPGGVFAARVDANGTPLDREPIQLWSGTVRSSPKIACGAVDCLIVWAGPVSETAHVRSMRMAPNGTPLDAQPLDHGPGLADDVVWTGDGYTIAFTTLQGIILTRIGGDSTFLASPRASGVALAWSGREFLLVWRDPDSLLYARADASGNILGAPQLLANGLFPVAIWTGRHFLVAFDSLSDDVIGGARISRGGVVVDRFPLSVSPGNHNTPALAIHDDGTIAVSYTRSEASQRTYVRFARD